ncbi:NUDIX hydrolase [Candidatus Parcubacteria bacterium]|nr:NUDIX hydrolase [Candidatus Parcubacteria bacterium]
MLMDDKKSKIPRVAVKAVFRCGEYALYHETNGGVRDIPGGHIKFGETIIEALKRELREELNYDLKIQPKLLYAWTYISSDKKAHRVYIIYLIDLPRKINFVAQEAGSGLKFKWLHKDDIKKQKFLPEMENLLLKAF